MLDPLLQLQYDILTFSLFLTFFHVFPYSLRAMEATKNILNNVAFKTAEQLGLAWATNFPYTFASTVSLTMLGENGFKPSFHRTKKLLSFVELFMRNRMHADGNTDIMVVRVKLIYENHMNVSFPYDVPGIKPPPAFLPESENLYLAWAVTWRCLTAKRMVHLSLEAMMQ